MCEVGGEWGERALGGGREVSGGRAWRCVMVCEVVRTSSKHLQPSSIDASPPRRTICSLRRSSFAIALGSFAMSATCHRVCVCVIRARAGGEGGERERGGGVKRVCVGGKVLLLLLSHLPILAGHPLDAKD